MIVIGIGQLVVGGLVVLGAILISPRAPIQVTLTQLVIGACFILIGSSQVGWLR